MRNIFFVFIIMFLFVGLLLLAMYGLLIIEKKFRPERFKSCAGLYDRN